MFLLRALLLLLLVVVPPLCVIHMYFRGYPPRLRFLFLLPNFVLLLWALVVALNHSYSNSGTLFRILFLFFLMAFCVPELIFTIIAAVGRLFPFRVVRLGFTLVGLVVAVLCVYVAVVGFWDSNRRFRVVEHRVVLPGLPSSFNGFRLVQFSDFHLGSYYGRTDFVRRVCDSINAARPDLIAFTGDLVNSRSVEADPYLEILSSLRSPNGVLAVLGNHDYMIYSPSTSRQKQADLERLCDLERRLGWKLLNNAGVLISNATDTIAILGSENSGRPPFPDYGDLAKASAGLPDSVAGRSLFKILLSHDPAQWERSTLPRTDVSLTLSGHTHGLQVDFPFFHPCKLVHKHGAGFYRSGDRLLFVNTGIGAALVPFRFGVWPRVDVLVLYNK